MVQSSKKMPQTPAKRGFTANWPRNFIAVLAIVLTAALFSSVTAIAAWTPMTSQPIYRNRTDVEPPSMAETYETDIVTGISGLPQNLNKVSFGLEQILTGLSRSLGQKLEELSFGLEQNLAGFSSGLENKLTGFSSSLEKKLLQSTSGTGQKFFRDRAAIGISLLLRRVS